MSHVFIGTSPQWLEKPDLQLQRLTSKAYVCLNFAKENVFKDFDMSSLKENTRWCVCLLANVQVCEHDSLAV